MYTKKEKISIVVPCYNEEKALPFFYEEIKKVSLKMTKLEFEFIFVDDGSVDKTIEIIKKFRSEDKRVRYVSFSRNFGKEAAMLAGLEYSTGDFVALMDADLQDPPQLLPQMYEIIKEEGCGSVGTRRVSRKGEPRIRSFFARLFYKLMKKMCKIEVVDGARDYRLMSRKVANSIILMKEYNRYSKGLFGFVGYETKWIEYENVERVAGETKWSFWKLFIYAIEGIVAFTTVPLSIATMLGFIFCLLSFIGILCIIIKTIFLGNLISGWSSLVFIILFVSGIQLLCIGILGKYLEKTYLEVKRRPIYIVNETEQLRKNCKSQKI